MDLCTPSCHHKPRAEGFPQVLAPSMSGGQTPACGVPWLRAYNSCFQLLFKKGAQDGSKEPPPGIFRGPSGGGGDFPGAQGPAQVMYPAQVERNPAEEPLQCAGPGVPAPGNGPSPRCHLPGQTAANNHQVM